MFSKLSKENASLEELAQNFVEVVQFQNDLRAQYNAANERVTDLQLKAFMNQEVGELLEQEKRVFADTKSKIDACSLYLKKLKGKLADSIPVTFKRRADEIKQECTNLSRIKQESLNEFLSMAAKCQVYFEQIEGERYSYTPSTGLMKTGPELNINRSTLLGQDYEYFKRQVEKERKSTTDGTSMKMKLNRLSKEKAGLEKSLENYDPETEIQRILEKAGLNTFSNCLAIEDTGKAQCSSCRTDPCVMTG
ncbi:MAG: hypothetical protein FP816_15680 [Desulfobacteraceae bacterium]|nr:hypothetical protein [Desulfobacteraceae bacterium]MBU3948960.1 hypothetical protein [Pseudomonadota bacterium]